MLAQRESGRTRLFWSHDRGVGQPFSRRDVIRRTIDRLHPDQLAVLEAQDVECVSRPR